MVLVLLALRRSLSESLVHLICSAGQETLALSFGEPSTVSGHAPTPYARRESNGISAGVGRYCVCMCRS